MKDLRKTSLILIAAGIVSIIIAVIFKQMQWPGAHLQSIAGPTALIVGVILYLIHLKREKKNDSFKDT